MYNRQGREIFEFSAGEKKKSTKQQNNEQSKKKKQKKQKNNWIGWAAYPSIMDNYCIKMIILVDSSEE